MPVTYEMCQRCTCLYERGTACDRCGTARSRTQAASPPRMAGPPDPTHVAISSHPITLPISAAPIHDARSREVHSFTFHGNGGSLLGIHVVNLLLTIITLGFYSFWGKVRVRNYQLGQTEFQGDRFAYHGTGRELINGSFKAGAILGCLSVPVRVLNQFPVGNGVKWSVAALAYSMLLVLISVAILGSRRYRLSRSSWRGIRFSLRAPLGEFVKLFVNGILLTGLTLGVYYPIFVTKQFGFLTAHSYFGNRRFEFDGHGRDLMRAYLLMAFLLLPTLGLSLIWWKAAKQRYLWSRTSFGELRLRSTVTGGALFKLYAMNSLLLIVTAGVAWPWVTVRNLRFAFDYLSCEGAIDLSSISQEAQSASAMGEGLDAALDLDAGFAA
jgi:uncharacterized membrane protein YjgN (DUF898 family)